MWGRDQIYPDECIETNLRSDCCIFTLKSAAVVLHRPTCCGASTKSRWRSCWAVICERNQGPSTKHIKTVRIRSMKMVEDVNSNFKERKNKRKRHQGTNKKWEWANLYSSIHPSVRPSVRPSIHRSIHLSIYLRVMFHCHVWLLKGTYKW